MRLEGTKFFWQVYISAVRVGLKEKLADGTRAAWKLNENSVAYPDTGTSFLIMPEAVYHVVMPVIIGTNEHTIDRDDYYIINCNDEFESLYLLIGDKWYEVPPSQFIFPIPGYI